MNDITALMATMKAVAEKATEFGEERLYVKAGSVLALVEALEKAQRQTTESENCVRKQNRHICELFDDNTALRQRIASLEESHAQVIQSRDHYKRMSEEGLKQLVESRTVTVKLPEVRITVAESRRKNLTWRELGAYNEGADVAAEKISKVLVAAGIQVIEGEGQ